MEKTIPIEWLLSAIAAFLGFIFTWLWKLHDNHHALANKHHELETKLAGKYMEREDVLAMVTDLKAEIRMGFSEIKEEGRSGRMELLAVLSNKVDKP